MPAKYIKVSDLSTFIGMLIQFDKFPEDVKVRECKYGVKSLCKFIDSQRIKRANNKKKRLGEDREQNDIKLFEDTHELKVIKNNEKSYFMKIMDGLYVIGKFDGLVKKDGELCLFETKHRVSSIKEQIPVYERVQIEVYLRMLKLNKCLFNQVYKPNDLNTYEDDEISRVLRDYTSSDTDIQQKLIEYDRDDVFWDNIKNNIIKQYNKLN